MHIIKQSSLLSFLVAFALPTFVYAHEGVHELAREKRKLAIEAGKLFRSKNLNKDSEYQATQETAFKASRTYTSAKKNHPKLKELATKSDAAMKKIIDARVAKDNDAARAAQKEYTQTRIDLEKAAQGIPEIVELQKKAIAANEAVKKKEHAILATTPEGKELIQKIEALDAKIKALQKKMMPLIKPER